MSSCVSSFLFRVSILALINALTLSLPGFASQTKENEEPHSLSQTTGSLQSETPEEIIENLRLGRKYLHEGNFQKTLEYLKPYMKTQDIKDIGTINNDNDILFLYHKIGELFFEKAKDIQLNSFKDELLKDSINFNLKITESNNLYYACNSFFNIAQLQEYKGNIEEAEKYYKVITDFSNILITYYYNDNLEKEEKIKDVIQRSYKNLADVYQKKNKPKKQSRYLSKLIEFPINNDLKLETLVDLGFLNKNDLPEKALIHWKDALSVAENDEQRQYINYHIGVLLYKRDKLEDSKKYLIKAAELEHFDEARLGAYLRLASFRDANHIKYLEQALALSNGSFRAYILWELFCYDVIGDDLRYLSYLEECAYLGYKPAIELLSTFESSKKDKIEEILNHQNTEILGKLKYSKKEINNKEDKIKGIQENSQKFLKSLQTRNENLLKIDKSNIPVACVNFFHNLQNDRKNINEQDALRILKKMPEIQVTEAKNKYTVSIKNENLKSILCFGYTIGSHVYHPKVKSRNKECLDPNFAKDLLELLRQVYDIP